MGRVEPKAHDSSFASKTNPPFLTHDPTLGHHRLGSFAPGQRAEPKTQLLIFKNFESHAAARVRSRGFRREGGRNG
jgi:hypothetical protein